MSNDKHLYDPPSSEEDWNCDFCHVLMDVMYIYESDEIEVSLPGTNIVISQCGHGICEICHLCVRLGDYHLLLHRMLLLCEHPRQLSREGRIQLLEAYVYGFVEKRLPVPCRRVSK